MPGITWSGNGSACLSVWLPARQLGRCGSAMLRWLARIVLSMTCQVRISLKDLAVAKYFALYPEGWSAVSHLRNSVSIFFILMYLMLVPDVFFPDDRWWIAGCEGSAFGTMNYWEKAISWGLLAARKLGPDDRGGFSWQSFAAAKAFKKSIKPYLLTPVVGLEISM